MVRDQRRDTPYWDESVDFYERIIAGKIEEFKTPPRDPTARATYLFGLARDYWQLILSRYSRGDAIAPLADYFPPMLEQLERADRMYRELAIKPGCFAWYPGYVNPYLNPFWLVGLALALNIPDDQWRRLVKLVGHEGEDQLLDRIIATRQPERKIGEKLFYPKPYKRLLAAIDAPPKQQAKKLFTFVDKWYPELERRAEDRVPYWYGDLEIHNNYFGYWCIEAVAAVKAFGLDDSLCLGHPNYPGDLLRPNGPTTHCPAAASAVGG